jgi:hypothetical protein
MNIEIQRNQKIRTYDLIIDDYMAENRKIIIHLRHYEIIKLYHTIKKYFKEKE